MERDTPGGVRRILVIARSREGNGVRRTGIATDERVERFIC